jgi:hypothetical protein
LPAKEINPPAGAEAHRVDFELVPGPKVRLRVVDLQRRPVAGVRVAFHITPYRVFEDRQTAADFDVAAFGPNARRKVMIWHEERSIGKVVDVGLGDDKDGPVVVRLDPLATIEGRVIDAEGKPAPFMSIETRVLGQFKLALAEASTDRNGKFIVPNVPVGCDYHIQANASTTDETSVTSTGTEHDKPVSVRPGATIDIGEIRFADDPKFEDN